MRNIRYRAGYKYQLSDSYSVGVTICPEYDIDTDYIGLTRNGLLSIEKGYAWDGPSGPTVDTPSFMRGSLIHDSLYQLIREGNLSEEDREAADLELHRICLEDGMSRLRAWWVWRGVRLGGGPAADPKNERPVLTAPEEVRQV